MGPSCTIALGNYDATLDLVLLAEYMHGSADVLRCLSFDVCSWLCGICCVFFVARCLFVCLFVCLLMCCFFGCLFV